MSPPSGGGRCPGPLVVHQQLFGLADVEFQLNVGPPCDEGLCQSSVLLVFSDISVDVRFSES